MTGPDPARSRFAILSAVRLTAAIMVGAGIVIAFGEREFVSEAVKMPLGLGLIAIGFIDLLVLVPMLTRRWRSQQ